MYSRSLKRSCSIVFLINNTSACNSVYIHGASLGSLFFARLLKLARPLMEVVVVAAQQSDHGPERGFETVELIGDYDPELRASLPPLLGRAELLHLLREGCCNVGVRLPLTTQASVPAFDLLVCAVSGARAHMAIEDATLLFDSCWNASWNLPIALAAFNRSRERCQVFYGTVGASGQSNQAAKALARADASVGAGAKCAAYSLFQGCSANDARSKASIFAIWLSVD